MVWRSFSKHRQQKGGVYCPMKKKPITKEKLLEKGAKGCLTCDWYKTIYIGLCSPTAGKECIYFPCNVSPAWTDVSNNELPYNMVYLNCRAWKERLTEESWEDYCK